MCSALFFYIYRLFILAKADICIKKILYPFFILHFLLLILWKRSSSNCRETNDKLEHNVSYISEHGLFNQYTKHTHLYREKYTPSAKKKNHQYTHLHIHCTYTSKIYPYSNNQYYSEPRIIQDINNDGGQKKKRKKDGHTSWQLFIHMQIMKLDSGSFLYTPQKTINSTSGDSTTKII